MLPSNFEPRRDPRGVLSPEYASVSADHLRALDELVDFPHCREARKVDELLRQGVLVCLEQLLVGLETVGSKKSWRGEYVGGPSSRTCAVRTVSSHGTGGIKLPPYFPVYTDPSERGSAFGSSCSCPAAMFTIRRWDTLE